MQSNFLSFSLAISFFMACCALNNNNLQQQLPEWGSVLSSSDDSPPDPTLDNQRTVSSLMDNKNEANLSPFVFDQTWITPSVGNANLGEAHAAATATTAGAEDSDSQVFPLLAGGAGDCHASENFKRGEDQTKHAPPLLCPVLPGQKFAPPVRGAAGEEKEPVRRHDPQEKIQEPPPISSAEFQFDWNEQICPPDIHGATRQVPVCHSGIEFLKKFDSSLESWTLWGIRPCKLNQFIYF